MESPAWRFLIKSSGTGWLRDPFWALACRTQRARWPGMLLSQSGTWRSSSANGMHDCDPVTNKGWALRWSVPHLPSQGICEEGPAFRVKGTRNSSPSCWWRQNSRAKPAVVRPIHLLPCALSSWRQTVWLWRSLAPCWTQWLSSSWTQTLGRSLKAFQSSLLELVPYGTLGTVINQKEPSFPTFFAAIDFLAGFQREAGCEKHVWLHKHIYYYFMFGNNSEFRLGPQGHHPCKFWEHSRTCAQTPWSEYMAITCWPLDALMRR